MDSCSVLIALVFISLCFYNAADADKYRVCVVDGRGGFKRAGKYCPILDKTDSKVECVVGIDRLDCLRKISKGKADFSVFTPEDLVTATNSEVEVLLTNEMRFTKDKYEYKVTAVVSDDAGIRTKHDLKDKKLCHPGYGYETDWTNIIANYLEASVIPQSCEPSLTLTENRISASSKFFRSACKAGPWVKDAILDEELKRKYPNLCELCNSPFRCSTSDKYWGRRGPLYCLTDGLGDVSWARLDDIQAHFGILPGTSVVPTDGYSYLCPDDTTMPLNTTKEPCVWVVKPWPVIASQRKKAQEIQQLFNGLNQNDPGSWEYALFSLIETFKQDISPLDPVEPIESYLDNAPGFLSANSFSGCHPPRTVRVCTTSNIANAKCGWMREAAAVYGVEPDLECIKADNTTHCMEAINLGQADVVFASADDVHVGRSRYKLKTLLYETVADEDKYLTVAVVKADSSYQTFKDLQGAKACFPSYDGVAWNSVVYTLKHLGLMSTCPFSQGVSEFFGESCVPRLPKQLPGSLKSLCQDDIFNGEYGVVRCLNKGNGDVGFMSQHMLDKFFKDPREMVARLRRDNFKILCESPPCHLSWATPGQAMISSNASSMWVKETLDVFLQLDTLFGKNYKSVTTPFTLFGLFDGQPNVVVHDATLKFKTVPYAKTSDNAVRHYDDVLKKTGRCLSSANFVGVPTFVIISLSLVTSFY